MIKVTLLIAILYANLTFAQTHEMSFCSGNLQVAIKTSECLPKFDFHIAAGLSAGGRVGLRYLFVDNFSAEIAFGLDLRNFISLSDFQRRYSIGLNYHLKNGNGTLGLLTTYIEQPNSVYEAILFSPSFGFISIRKSGLNVFYRLGISIEAVKNYPSGKWNIEDVIPNLDVGISYNF